MKFLFGLIFSFFLDNFGRWFQKCDYFCSIIDRYNCQ